MKFRTIVLSAVVLFAAAGQYPAHALEALSLETLKSADYIKGKRAFQSRCSACHTLADNSGDIAGPNLWGIFDRIAGQKEGFQYSDALSKVEFKWTPDRINEFLADPRGYIVGNIMVIPEAVPESERINIVSFMMIETGAVDWPRPEQNFAEEQTDRSRPPSERFPSFWNHLMFNTTRYRWVDADGEFKFDAYFKTDGTVASSEKGMDGFWHITERDFFCYALKGMPVSVGHMVECFPVAAMAIPRFAGELWKSAPQKGVILHGGMVAGRPDWVYGQQTAGASNP